MERIRCRQLPVSPVLLGVLAMSLRRWFRAADACAGAAGEGQDASGAGDQPGPACRHRRPAPSRLAATSAVDLVAKLGSTQWRAAGLLPAATRAEFEADVGASRLARQPRPGSVRGQQAARHGVVAADRRISAWPAKSAADVVLQRHGHRVRDRASGAGFRAEANAKGASEAGGTRAARCARHDGDLRPGGLGTGKPLSSAWRSSFARPTRR